MAKRKMKWTGRSTTGHTRGEMIEAGTIRRGLADIDCVCPVHFSPGCPGGDYDGCPDCLSGRARRLLSSAKEVRG